MGAEYHLVAVAQAQSRVSRRRSEEFSFSDRSIMVACEHD